MNNDYYFPADKNINTFIDNTMSMLMMLSKGKTGQEWSAAYVVLLMGVYWLVNNNDNNNNNN